MQCKLCNDHGINLIKFSELIVNLMKFDHQVAGPIAVTFVSICSWVLIFIHFSQPSSKPKTCAGWTIFCSRSFRWFPSIPSFLNPFQASREFCNSFFARAFRTLVACAAPPPPPRLLVRVFISKIQIKELTLFLKGKVRRLPQIESVGYLVLSGQSDAAVRPGLALCRGTQKSTK